MELLIEECGMDWAGRRASEPSSDPMLLIPVGIFKGKTCSLPLPIEGRLKGYELASLISICEYTRENTEQREKKKKSRTQLIQTLTCVWN